MQSWFSLIPAGRGSLPAGDPEAPQADDVLRPGVPHQVSVQHGREADRRRVQRVHADDGRHHRQHGAAAHVHDEDMQRQRR